MSRRHLTEQQLLTLIFYLLCLIVGLLLGAIIGQAR